MTDPAGEFMKLVAQGQAAEARRDGPAAVAAYERAIALNPGHAFPFTRRALILFRTRFGAPLPARVTDPGRPRVTMSTLGANGRFGNQLLQYGFLRMYAEVHGLAAEAPDWIGRDLFDLDDPLCGPGLPPVREDQADFVASLNRKIPEIWRNADLWGYCIYPTGGLRPHRDFFRRLFRPGRKVAAAAAQAEDVLGSRGETVVAVHLRRGDFGYGRFWIAPAAWYAQWLDAVWPTLRRPVLYVATDDPASAAELARFRPVTAADLGIDLPGAEFYPDFHVLTRASLVAISNSSFSFVAAMLNEGAATLVRPDLRARGLARFDPWDAPVVL